MSLLGVSSFKGRGRARRPLEEDISGEKNGTKLSDQSRV